MTSLWRASRAGLALGVMTMTLQAGALRLEVGNPQANPAAKKLNAVVVARVTACHEPAKSVVTANALRMEDGKVQRTPLQVVALGEPGVFAVTGSLPAAKRVAIELGVTNPQFQNYEPKTLVRVDGGAIQWGSLKQFYSTPPTTADLRAILESGVEVTSIR